MTKRPDLIVVLALIFGFGAMATSFSSSTEQSAEMTTYSQAMIR